MSKFKELCRKLFDRTFWKFILVGVVNTLFGTAIMFVFYNCLHLSYWLSSASNYFFGSILSYFLNKYFTFQNKSKSWKTVLKFAVNIGACYLVAYGMVPVGGYYTIDARQAFEMKQLIDPRVTLPMHYRGPGFGYEVLAPVDDFAVLCGDAEYFGSNILQPDKLSGKVTAVLKCPVSK